MQVSSWRALVAGAALSLSASVATAQQKSPIGTGAWIVGGSAGFSHTDQQGGASTNDVGFAPFGLRFFAPHLALGGTVTLDYNWGSIADNDTHTSFIGISPTVRYYFGDLAGKTFPYLNASVGPSHESFHSESNGTNTDGTATGLDFTGSVGLLRMVSTHVGLSGEAFYTHTHRATDEASLRITQDNSQYGLRFGFSAFVF